jgi:HPt (histidine-containing phosphotransfer) domain-containing protein
VAETPPDPSAGFWANQGAVPQPASSQPQASTAAPAPPAPFAPVATPAIAPVPLPEPSAAPAEPVEASPEAARPKDRAEVFRATRAQLDDIFSPRPQSAVQPEPVPAAEPAPAWTAPTAPSVTFAAAEPAGPQPPSLASNVSALGGGLPPVDSAAASEELVRRFAPAPQESLLEQVGFAPAATTYPAPAADPLAPAPAFGQLSGDPLAPPVASHSPVLADPLAPAQFAPAAPPVTALFSPAPAEVQAAVPGAAVELTTATLTSGDGGPQAPPLDIETSQARIGDEAFWSELITMYRHEVEDRLSTIERALKLGDEEAVRHEAHTIKGSSAELALEGMRGYAMQLEKQAQTGDLAAAAGTAVAMRTEFERFKRYLVERRPDLA